MFVCEILVLYFIYFFIRLIKKNKHFFIARSNYLFINVYIYFSLMLCMIRKDVSEDRDLGQKWSEDVRKGST